MTDSAEDEKHTGGLVLNWVTTNDDTVLWQPASATQPNRSANDTGHET